jgi:alkyl hydroperoxide reductase subunit AhpC
LILACSREQAEGAKHQMQVPFPVLADEDMQVHKAVGALGAQAVPAAALYVTDRFLEVYAAWRTGEGDSLPSASEVVSWLAYIDSQCPECTQAEWPKDD